MAATVFRVMQDIDYCFMRISKDDYKEWTSKMSFEQSRRGALLKSLWSENWTFIPMIEEGRVEQPKFGVGDLAEMNRLLSATNETAFDMLASLLQIQLKFSVAAMTTSRSGFLTSSIE